MKLAQQLLTLPGECDLINLLEVSLVGESAVDSRQHISTFAILVLSMLA